MGRNPHFSLHYRAFVMDGKLYKRLRFSSQSFFMKNFGKHLTKQKNSIKIKLKVNLFLQMNF